MELLDKLYEAMGKNNIDAYIIPTSDYHSSEYISEYFQGRKAISGFTGSAGTLVALADSAYLWTDGRYFLQAEKELAESNIKLMKMGTSDPTIEEFLNSKLTDGQAIGFDGKVMPTALVTSLKKKITANVEYITTLDLVGKIWKARPALPFSIIYKLDTFFCGVDYTTKLKQVREKMESYGADTFILTTLEDQAWLYNLRANDIPHTPVFLAYTVITSEQVTLYVDQNKIDLSIEKYLDENDILVKPYNEIYTATRHFKNKTILMDLTKVNYALYINVIENNDVINKINPTLILKAIKNDTEIKNTKLAHIKDGVAVTKLMYYLKNRYGLEEMTELSVAEYLAKLRSEQEGFVDISFETICAMNEHGAIVHYSATPESNVKITDGLLLIDSGGHYLEGTTDITRTIALGLITDEMRNSFTYVLKSVIALSQAVFLKGCTGQNLDILARGPLWKNLYDYKHGTGHGVGYLLSVHEAPNGFRWNSVPERNDSEPLAPGMITTNEPGVYIEGKYGIRTENEMLCVKKAENESGTFYGFETLTLCPIDYEAINPDLLSQDEKNWVNEYNRDVYYTINRYLTEEESSWLRNVTITAEI